MGRGGRDPEVQANRDARGGSDAFRAGAIRPPVETRMNPMRILVILVATYSLIACGDTSTGSKPSRPEAVDIWTPAAVGDIAVLEVRLAKAGDVNALDPIFQTTALAFAASFGRPAAVDLLLEADANPNERNGNGSTPSVSASFFGRPECLQLLLEAGSDPNLADANGTTTYSALDVPWEITKRVAEFLRMPLDPDILKARRASCRALLEDRTPE